MEKRVPIIFTNLKKDDPPFLPPNLETFKYPQIQYFDFPDTVIHYLLTECSSNVYEKLIKNCKYFFSKKPVTVFPEVFVEYNFDIKMKSHTDMLYHSSQLSKIWITDYLLSYERHSENRSYAAISTFCPKIYKCQAKSVTIRNQRITQEEFYLLVQPEFVIVLSFSGTSILNTTKNLFLTIEDVVKRVPKARMLLLYDLPCTAKTFSILTNLKRQTKLSTFLCQSGFPSFKFFNTDVFEQFVTEHALPKAYFDINLGDIEVSLYVEYQKKMNDFANSWDPIADRPRIGLSCNTVQNRRRSASQTRWESSFCPT